MSCSGNAANVFAIAREAAIKLGKQNRFVNVGQVQEALRFAGYSSAELGNAAGSLFSKKLFRPTGNKVANTNPTARGRKVSVWEYFGPGSPIVPGANVGPATVTSVYTSPVANWVPATPRNTKPGVTFEIKPELRNKLTGNGKRPFTGKVLEITDNQRWPVRVEFTNGKRGLLDYDEFQVVN